MPRIDFYTNIADPLDYTCRLIRKISRQENAAKRLVLLDDAASLQALDAALWQFDASAFLPHTEARAQDAKFTPTLLTCDANLQDTECTLLINLSQHLPAGLERYQRVLEIVGQTEHVLQRARTRYAQYKKQGHELHHLST